MNLEEFLTYFKKMKKTQNEQTLRIDGLENLIFEIQKQVKKLFPAAEKEKSGDKAENKTIDLHMITQRKIV